MIPRRPILFALLILIAVQGLAIPHAEAGNPFTSGRPETERQLQAETPGRPSILQPLLDRVIHWQVALRQRMADFAVEIQVRPFGRSFWMFMLLAFAYGVVHALGPGHGKLLAASYFLNRTGGISQGLLFGYLAMLFHVLSATALVLLGYHVLRISASQAVEDFGGKLQTLSYALILALGVFLVLKTLLGLPRQASKNAPEQSPRGKERSDRHNLKCLWAASLGAGLAPCPGASMILIFSISLGIPLAGLLSMLCVSLGMGLTLAGIALAAIGSRDALLRIAGRRKSLAAWSHVAVSMAGALAVTAFGGLMLLGSLSV